MKQISNVDIQISIVDEDYSQEYSSISIPCGSGEVATLEALRGVVPALLEDAICKRKKKELDELRAQMASAPKQNDGVLAAAAEKPF